MNRRAIFAAGGALALAGGGLAATSFADDPSTPTSTDAKLSVLEQPAGKSADNPYATPLGRTLAAQRGDTIDPSSARGVTVGGKTVWIAETAKKSVCSSVSVGDDGAVATSCAAAGDFNRYGLFSETGDAKADDSVLTSVGVVPDGVTSVKLNQANGRAATATVNKNVVVATLSARPESVTLVSTQGAVRTVKLGVKR